MRFANRRHFLFGLKGLGIISLGMTGLGIVSSVPGYAQQRLSEHGFPLFQLRIQTQSSEILSLRVEVARTSKHRSKGLMHRESLSDSEGMLFVWSRQAVRQFWMKNTALPLDILFFDKDGILVHMAENQTPFNDELIPSLLPARFVLELPAGDTRRRGIQIGDKLILPQQ
ncbi:MAG: DUF192 domain-containing protein [Candidatus Puniceispirillaceae bacterium]